MDAAIDDNDIGNIAWSDRDAIFVMNSAQVRFIRGASNTTIMNCWLYTLSWTPCRRR